MSDKKYYYSEIFDSIQGEGTYTGVKTLWLRFFLCNLQCNGFGQIDPTNPETYDLPFEDFDVDSVQRVEDLPVWNKGCDSSYTWAKKFKKLMGHKTPSELVDEVMKVASNEHNPQGLFKHPISGQVSDMCFTGGEPLMRTGQACSVAMMKRFHDIGNMPRSVTYETNGTQTLTDDFINYWTKYKDDPEQPELFFSLSPKLWTVAGEQPTKAIKPEIVKQYFDLSQRGHLKFVLGSKVEQWDEMESVLKQFREIGVEFPVYIMPVGATEEDQIATAGDVANIAIKRGYNVAGRLHCYLFGNQIGT